VNGYGETTCDEEVEGCQVFVELLKADGGHAGHNEKK